MEQECTARGIWEQVRDRLVETLDSITLADLKTSISEAYGADS
jgi:DNA-binding IscR family transcriptional regulator